MTAVMNAGQRSDDQYVSLAPLLALFPDADDREIAWRCGVTRRQVQRWRHHQVRLQRNTADRAAINMGLHPVLIWWEEW